MPTITPLAALVNTLAEVHRQAKQQVHNLSKSEANTRSNLIDPVLCALGWNTADAGMVELEHAGGHKLRIDYALKDINGKIRIGVEAKKLGENIENRSCFAQALGYAFTLQTASFFVTDGLNWHCYSNQLGPPIAKIKLADDGFLANAMQLIQLLDAAHSGHGMTSTLFVQNQRTRIAQIKTNIQAEADKQEIEYQLALNLTVKSKTDRKYRKLTSRLPSSITGRLTWFRLPDTTEHKIKSWRDVLKKSAEFVLDSQADLDFPIYDKTGDTKLIIRSKRKYNYPNYTHLERDGMWISIYSSNNTEESATNALYILKMLPKSKLIAEPAVAFAT